MLNFDDSKYPPPPSEIAAYQVTDPTICRSECRISDLWVFGYLNLLSNLLCGGGATMLYFFRPLLLDYMSPLRKQCEAKNKTWYHLILKRNQS